MNNLLVALAVFVITVVGAMFAVPHFVDWNTYRSGFEEEASRIIGREVQVDGDVTLHVLPVPYFRLEKVRIADSSADMTFFKADSVSIRLSIPPMFRGIVEATEVEFQRPIVRLAVDAKDTWNWQSFANQLSSTGYMPANVALTSVKIADGVVAIHGADGSERARFETLNGELAAPALQGPYRFRGTYMAGRAAREVRLATSAPDDDGAVRMRASLRFLDSGATYVLDGRATDLMRKAQLEGELTARLPIAGLWQPAVAAAPPPRPVRGTEEEHKLESGEEAFDIKANVKADAAGAELSNLAVSFEQGGRPQIITGEVHATWRNDLALRMNLSSRWLDLDRVTASEHAGPIEGIAKFATRLRDFAPGRRAEVTLALEQASLGKEAVGPLQIVLKRTDDKLDIQNLQVALPGATRAEVQGSIFDTAQSVVFNGRLALRGTSVARFLTWATGNTVPLEAKADGVFGLRAQVTADDTRVSARDIVGNLSGTTLNGTAHYRWDGTPELAVALEGPQIDARSFLPAGAGLGDIYAYLLRSSDAKTDAAPPSSTPQPAWWRRAQADLSLRINAGQLATVGRVYRDVAAVMEMKSGNVRQLQLKLSGDQGYKIELEGAFDNARTHPKGTLRGVATVSAPSGVAPLVELLGVPETFRPEETRAKALVPLRLAGTAVFGARTPTSSDIVLDGTAGGAPARTTVRLDGGPGGWRTGPAEVTATLNTPEAAKLANLLVPGRAGGATGAGRLLVKAAGVPEQGMATVASFAAGDASLDFRGQVAAGDAGLKSSGELAVRVADAGSLASLLGVTPVNLQGVPLAGRMDFSAGDGKIALEKLATKVGENRLAGYIRLFPGRERRRVEASLDLDDLSLARLLNPLLDDRFAVAREAEAAVAGRQGAWPDDQFSADIFDAFEGTVQITSRRLILDEGLALARATVNVTLAAGKIEVSEISGAAAGGAFKGQFVVSKAPGGADMRGSLELAGILDSVAKGRAAGPFKLALDYAGRGLSPRSLISALQGRGTLTFGDAKVDALWPGAIALAANAGQQAEPDRVAATVQRTVAGSLASGSLSLAQKTFGLELADGLLRTQPLTIEMREGRVAGSAAIDLRAFTFDSHWRLEAATGPGETPGKPIPAVTVAYGGPLTALGSVEPRLDTARLEQEVSARKIERDVEELERLRKLDEQRRLMEAERMRKQFDNAQPVPRPQLPTAVPVVPMTPSSREMRPVPPPG